MTNPYRNEAALEIDGETYVLRATFGALAEIEAAAAAADLKGRYGVRYALIALKALSAAGGREIPAARLAAMGASMLDAVTAAINAAMEGKGGPEKNAVAAATQAASHSPGGA
jgi:hypothetical protein